ncbi:MAG: ABC transporter ATP-binding protein [Bacilli bacterium]|nr:ABC transporter ATP-binding protein [Bacilli bacterium]
MKLEIKNLNKNYQEKQVLKNINYTFEEGKIYGLVGRNGAGKTTFFNALNEDIRIDSGTFLLENEYGKNKLSSNDIGYVTATPIVPEFLTGKEFLKFFLDINKENIEDIKEIDEYFEFVKIQKEDQDTLLKDYSTGMKNKIQLLVNIIRNPKILLLDEPLTSLDIVVQEDMKKLLKKIKKDHIIILSTHILEIALDLCDEILVLNNKKIECIEKKDLNTKAYKDKIIKMLKDEKNVE